MQAATIREKHTYYRCLARTLVPGSSASAHHPRTVNLREDELLGPLNGWIGRLFARENVDRTVAALVASQDQPGGKPESRIGATKRLADAEARLRRFQTAIASGVDPAALVEAINEAQAERAAARAELKGTPVPSLLTDAEVYAMVDSLGDVGAALADARAESLGSLYHALGLELRYQPAERAVYATASPRVVSARVRGGTPTRPRGIPAQCRYPCGEATRVGKSRYAGLRLGSRRSRLLWCRRFGASNRRGPGLTKPAASSIPRLRIAWYVRGVDLCWPAAGVRWRHRRMMRRLSKIRPIWSGRFDVEVVAQDLLEDPAGHRTVQHLGQI